jgi:hypothetical protein
MVMSIVIVSGAGCGSSKPTAPDTGLTGVWTGTIVEAAESTMVRMELAQQGQGVTGSFSSTTSSGLTVDGTVTGTINGSRVAAFLTPSSSMTCPNGTTISGTLNATLTVTGAKAAGEVTGFQCGGVRVGTIEVTRQ